MGALPDNAPTTIPSGTITFVFTDIEGSTQRWDRDRAAMQSAVRRHDVLLREAIVAHHGHVFKTIGDAFCAAFARPEDAVAAMFEAQRALGAEDFSAVDGIRVRAAIHTGTADERDRDYFGPAVNRVARLLAIGHGGQVLLSGISADLVQGALPPRASLRDLGEHRLKDLARPEYVYQLVAPDLIPEFPPLRSLDLRPHNLPLQFTSLVGREVEIGEISDLVAEHRLVTLVGSGGIGKTRVSLQVAANLLDRFGDGVWFIELAPLSNADHIAPAIAQELRLTLAHGEDPLVRLVRSLEPKRALFVFDNCEHLIEASARVVSAILKACPHINVIASSRQGLRIAGEAAYRLPSLRFPSASDIARAAPDGTRFSAIALFVERARAVENGFALTDENAFAVAEICRRLDGIPLAIELAASRVRMLSPQQLRERLDERFRVLTGGRRDVMPRQQTLRALIDWSHELLDERETALFRRVGIFVSRFSLEAATTVAAGGDLDELDVFDALASLVDKSLVLAESAGDSVRYRLLESTRAYAREKLAAAGERDVIAGRHLHSLRARFSDASDRWKRTARNTEVVELLSIELDDIRAALDWAISGFDVSGGGELLAAIGLAWRHVGLESEAEARLTAFAAALSEGVPLLRSRVLCVLARMASASGNLAHGRDAAREAIGCARASGDAAALADALVAFSCGAKGAQLLDEAAAALDEAETIGNLSTALRLELLHERGVISSLRGDIAAAVVAFDRARVESRALGYEQGEQILVSNIAELEHMRGETRRAIALLDGILPAARATSSAVATAHLLMNLAAYHVAVDDVDASSDAAREAIRVLAAANPESFHLAVSTEHLSLAIALAGDLSRAARLAGYAESAMTLQDYKRQHTESITHDRLTALLVKGLEETDRARLLAEGALFAPEAAIALALENH
jgi:predicted ATPase/class 3 adenylate cyclase